MQDPDVIIVGAGVAGCSAAVKMANNGLNVVLIDRGMPIGSKNLSGGVLWGNDLAEIIPNWQEEAPIERFIVNKKVGFLSENDATVLDFHFDSWNDSPHAGVSLLRAPFDEWLAEKAQEAGVSVLSGITIDALIIENDQVVGVRQNQEELRANLIIIAEGANPRLLLKHKLTYREDGRYDPSDFALGIKEVISLDQTVLEERFLLDGDQGLAGEFIMGNLKGSNVLAGGFFYTNKSSLSIGVVLHLDSLETKDRSYEVIEQFKAHPYIKRLIKNGESIEYGAKLIPEMGYKKFPQPYGAGYLIIGDAAGFVFSNGITIQGMNYGIQSGLLAADVAIDTKRNNDYSHKSLRKYKKLLDESYIMKDFKRLRNVKKMTKNPRLFQIYPDAINNAFKEILEENGDPKNNIIKILRKNMKDSGAGLFTLMKDGLKARHL